MLYNCPYVHENVLSGRHQLLSDQEAAAGELHPLRIA